MAGRLRTRLPLCGHFHWRAYKVALGHSSQMMPFYSQMINNKDYRFFITRQHIKLIDSRPLSQFYFSNWITFIQAHTIDQLQVTAQSQCTPNCALPVMTILKWTNWGLLLLLFAAVKPGSLRKYLLMKVTITRTHTLRQLKWTANVSGKPSANRWPAQVSCQRLLIVCRQSSFQSTLQSCCLSVSLSQLLISFSGNSMQNFALSFTVIYWWCLARSTRSHREHVLPRHTALWQSFSAN